MLRTIRENSRSTGAKIVLAIIIIPFVFFGVESMFSGGGGEDVASVNGESIDEMTFQNEVIIYRNQILAQSQGQIDYSMLTAERLGSQVLEDLVRKTLTQQLSDSYKIIAPEVFVDQQIVRNQAFQVDGKFSADLMEATLSDRGYTLSMIKSRISDEIINSVWQSGLAASTLVNAADVNLLGDAVTEQRNILWAKLSLDEFVQRVELSEREVSDFYQTNIDLFKTELLADVEYLLLERDTFDQAARESISEEVIAEEYKARQSSFAASEVREVSHILFEQSDERSQSDIEVLAAQIIERVQAGEAFADLAKEFSQDVGTASDGGYLGEFEKDGSFPRAFEEAMFSTGENQLSELIETDAGFHLIYVSSINDQEFPPLFQMEHDIRDQLANSVAQRDYSDALERLADLSFNAEDLADPADSMKLEIQTLSEVSKNLGGQGDEVDSLLNDQRVKDAIFDEEVLIDGLNSEVIELDGRRAIVLRVTDVQQPRVKDVDEVREQIVTALEGEKANRAIDELLGKELVDANAEKFREKLINAGAEVKEFNELTRQSTELNRATLIKIFATPGSQVGRGVQSVELSSGNRAVFQVSSIDAGAVPSSQELELLQGQVGFEVGSNELAAFHRYIKDAAEIEYRTSE